MKPSTFYGIWCYDNPRDYNKADWLRELPSKVADGGEAILVYTSIRAAQHRAAEHFGFDTYTEVKKNGWAIVKPLTEAK